jgi:hypothetical protein
LYTEFDLRFDLLMSKRKLGSEPPKVGKKWRVVLSDGTYDDYDSKVDALKAHHCALNVAAQLDKLHTTFGYWASELAVGVRGKAARLGSTRKDLAPLAEDLYDLMIELATKG